VQNNEDHVDIGHNIECNNVNADGGHDDDADERGDVPGPTVLASVELAKTVGMCLTTSIKLY
jgi:hypothetical protein